MAARGIRWWEWLAPVALVAGLTYIMGWAFAQAYFAEFGVGLIALDIPHQYFFVYGFRVVLDSAWIVLSVYAILILAAWRLRSRFHANPELSLAAMPLLVLLLFVGSYHLADSDGMRKFESQRDRDYPAFPRVEVWLHGSTADDPTVSRRMEVMSHELAGGCYRLLLDNGDTLPAGCSGAGVPGSPPHRDPCASPRSTHVANAPG